MGWRLESLSRADLTDSRVQTHRTKSQSIGLAYGLSFVESTLMRHSSCVMLMRHARLLALSDY